MKQVPKHRELGKYFPYSTRHRAIKTAYDCGENITVVISKLQLLASRLVKWFENNYMKSNGGKSLFKKTEKVTINEIALTSNIQEKLLGITFNFELKFEKHITSTCKKASQNKF